MTFTVDKDPQAVLDYGFDWSDWLNGDVISTSSWQVETGITLDSYENTSQVTTAWLSGGSLGRRYTVTNHIVTAGGREDDRTIIVKMASR